MPTNPNRTGVALRRSIALAVTEGKVPAEFRLFTAGEVDTTKGKFLFDDVAAQMVIAAQSDYANRLPIDYVHAMPMAHEAPDPEKAGKAAGWFSLEVRDGELWAVGVEWTPAGRKAVEEKEYLYTSPYFSVDEDNRIVEVLNCALTNMPATKGLDPLVSLSRAIDRRSAALAKGMSFNDTARAIEKAIADKFGERDDDGCLRFYPWICDVYDDRVIFDLKGKLFQVNYAVDGNGAVLSGDPVEVLRTYAPVPGGTNIMDKKQICAKLGLPEDATDEQVMAKLEEAAKALADGGSEGDDETKDLPPAALERFKLERDSRIALERKVAEMERQTKVAELSRVVTTDFKALSMKPEEGAAHLLTLREKAPEAATYFEGVMKRASAALSQSPLLKEIGSGGAPEGGTALDRLKAKAAELQRADPKLTAAEALSRATEQNPDLYAAHCAEKRS